MKRFWKDVSVENGEIRLDGKPVRTPGRIPLVILYPALAEAIADEWRRVEGEIDPTATPLTALANAAIEIVAPDPARFAAALAAYGESDLLYYRAEDPPELVARQAAAWDPLLAWARDRYDVHFETTVGVMHHPQPPATIARLAEAIAARAPYELAALSPIVTITGTLVGALALAEDAIDAETLWAAANIDEHWQTEKWGEDALAKQTRDAHRRDYGAAVRFLEAAR